MIKIITILNNINKSYFSKTKKKSMVITTELRQLLQWCMAEFQLLSRLPKYFALLL